MRLRSELDSAYDTIAGVPKYSVVLGVFGRARAARFAGKASPLYISGNLIALNGDNISLIIRCFETIPAQKRLSVMLTVFLSKIAGWILPKS